MTVFLLLSSLAAAGTFTATATALDTVERIVAKVNGEIITVTELETEVTSAIEQMGEAPTPEEQEQRIQQLREQLLDRMIDNMLILQVAAERGLRVPSRFFDEWKQSVMKEMQIEDEDEFVRQVELQGASLDELRKRFEDNLLMTEIRRMEVDSKVSVSEPEIEERYRQRIQDYTEPARVRLREIVVKFDDTNEIDKGEKARRLLQDIREGADFAEIARMHSESSSREAGGDLGFFDEGDLTEALQAAALALAPGEASEVIRLEAAFYIVRVEEKTEARTKPIEEVRNDVADSIYQEKMTEQMERYLRTLRERAIVEIKL
jgi:parvulin-like peptidyl-prolyl isomerase